MQGIITKFLSPANKLGARIKVTTTGSRKFSKTIKWDDGLRTDENHRAGAIALATELNWYGYWVSCDTNDGLIYVRTLPGLPGSNNDFLIKNQDIEAK